MVTKVRFIAGIWNWIGLDKCKCTGGFITLAVYFGSPGVVNHLHIYPVIQKNKKGVKSELCPVYYEKDMFRVELK